MEEKGAGWHPREVNGTGAFGGIFPLSKVHWTEAKHNESAGRGLEVPQTLAWTKGGAGEMWCFMPP